MRSSIAGLAVMLALAGCSAQEDPSPIDGGTTHDAGPTGHTVLHPNAPPLPGEVTCVVTEDTFTVASAQHVPVCQHVEYGTNPPSGGDHWPVWAHFGSYGAPVPREMYVHDLEHGAIVLSYRCAGPCPDVIKMLDDVRAKQGDTFCAAQGAAARIVLTPDSKLDVPVAASAWGATYRATCLDEASLRSFAETHYGHGPEALCADGVAQTDFPVCP